MRRRNTMRRKNTMRRRNTKGGTFDLARHIHRNKDGEITVKSAAHGVAHVVGHVVGHVAAEPLIQQVVNMTGLTFLKMSAATTTGIGLGVVITAEVIHLLNQREIGKKKEREEKEQREKEQREKEEMRVRRNQVKDALSKLDISVEVGGPAADPVVSELPILKFVMVDDPEPVKRGIWPSANYTVYVEYPVFDLLGSGELTETETGENLDDKIANKRFNMESVEITTRWSKIKKLEAELKKEGYKPKNPLPSKIFHTKDLSELKKRQALIGKFFNDYSEWIQGKSKTFGDLFSYIMLGQKRSEEWIVARNIKNKNINLGAMMKFILGVSDAI